MGKDDSTIGFRGGYVATAAEDLMVKQRINHP